jgi:hypothetical protein
LVTSTGDDEDKGIESDVLAPAVAAEAEPTPIRPLAQPEPATPPLRLVSNTGAILVDPEGAGTQTSPVEGPVLLDDAISDLVRHLDETLDLIRSMKAGAAS